jgi:selenocysteine lyase/cysteine desulfurase
VKRWKSLSDFGGWFFAFTLFHFSILRFMNESIRKLFPVTENYTYLNSAAVSPLPLPAVEAVLSQLKDVSANGTTNYLEWIATKDRVRGLIAEMLNVRADQIAFMRNTSDGFSTVANGLRWEIGDNIVSFEREFPANFYAWRSVRDRSGVQLRLCPEREGRIDLDEFIALIDENTKLVSISAVQFGSGFRADLAKIAEAAHAVDALFAVDIIQGFGAMAFDFPAEGVDIAAGASHKWLFSPEGCGLLYLSDRARARIEPTLVGWISVETPWDFAETEQPFKSTALAWESGTGASSLFYGLEQSLKLIHETGLKNIENYLEDLTDYLCELISGKDYQIISSRARGEKSQIVCIEHRNGLTSNELAKKLENEKIIVSPRGSRLRIAPHFFNNREDIEKLAENLP